MTNQKFIISYRQNESHEKLIPIIQSIIADISKDIEITLLEYPQNKSQEEVKWLVSELYPTIEDWTIYLSDYTSSIPYDISKDSTKTLVKKNLEEIYRKVFWLNASTITSYDECRDKSEQELRKFADRDIEVLAKVTADKLNSLDAIQRVEVVTDCLSHHIASLGRLRRILKENEWVTYDNNKERYAEIDKNIHDEYGQKLYRKIQQECSNKEVVLNDMIDMSWSSLDTERRSYLKSIDREDLCLINDGHNRLWNPNNWTEFRFNNALTIAPDSWSLWHHMERENRQKWEKRLMNADRLPTRELEESLKSELLKILKN